MRKTKGDVKLEKGGAKEIIRSYERRREKKVGKVAQEGKRKGGKREEKNRSIWRGTLS